MDINGKVAVVTGSSSGVGEATAKLLASLGASVVVNYFRGAESGQRIVDEIQAAGGAAIAVQADTRSDADCRRLIQSAVDEFGHLEILVNNAGMTHFIARRPRSGYRRRLGRHHRGEICGGVFNCARAARPLYAGFGRGSDRQRQ